MRRRLPCMAPFESLCTPMCCSSRRQRSQNKWAEVVTPSEPFQAVTWARDLAFSDKSSRHPITWQCMEWGAF